MEKCYTVMNESNPRILLSSSEIVTPFIFKNERTTYFDLAEKILKRENVKLIINVANDVKDKELHREMYKKLNINYINIGIDDTFLEPPIGFLEKVLKTFDNNYSSGAVLINCQAGVNRSALATAAILWKRLNNNRWETPEKLIEYMRACQKKDRDLDLLLINETFLDYFIDWAKIF